jgi:hypothetical protein
MNEWRIEKFRDLSLRVRHEGVAAQEKESQFVSFPYSRGGEGSEL